ncbi:MAG: hypothetical protein JW827_00665 [Spirochaetes bacterium]|nr:hypothetical protein [Spirochaetota bacterium]
MVILGLSFFYHDSGAALLKDGRIIAAAQEERFVRVKNTHEFPGGAINFCLEFAGLKTRDLDYVVFYEKPFEKFERIFKTLLASYPRSVISFRDIISAWFKEKLWVEDIISSKLNVPVEKIYFVQHHLSHAASTFFASPFKEAAILTIDGVGEWTTTAMGRGTADWTNGKNNSLILEKEVKFPHSLGLLYSAFTAFLGFKVNEGEYKVMGMAPYGQPKYTDKIKKLIELYEDGSFKLDLSYFSYHYHNQKTFNRKFIRLFGKPRDPKSEFIAKLKDWQVEYIEPQSKFYADIASSIQAVTEEIILKMAHEAHKVTKSKNLCIAGGVGLNSVANGKILEKTPFKNLYVQPASGDAGGAVGAALYLYHIGLKKPRKYIMDSAFLGKEYTDKEIRSFLDANRIPHQRFEDKKLFDEIIKAMNDKKIVGWFQGRFEWGPRALGNRSILADPRFADIKDIVNVKIKFREPYRPFAPAVLVEDCEKYFQIKNVRNNLPARFMLVVADVKKDKRKKIPAVTHVDGSGRLQTVDRKDNPRYYNLIKRFKQKTGVPVILNTSFNLKGEPIVNTPENAYHTFMKSGMDMLVLNNFLIKKEHLPKG